MNYHDHTPVFKNTKPSVLYEVEYGQLLKEQAELEKEKSTDRIPHTVAHYTSPQAGAVAFTNEGVAEVMKSYGMDVIQVCGDELAEIEGVGDLGLILEHQADIKSAEFKLHLDEIGMCLYQMGWRYDGWVGDHVDEYKEAVMLH